MTFCRKLCGLVGQGILKDSVIGRSNEAFQMLNFVCYIMSTKLFVGGSKLSQHIAEQLRASNRDNICFIPYNTGYHWILTIINEDKNMIYLLDSLSNRNRDHAWQTIVTNGVKLYNASRGISKGPGFKQLTGNLKQKGGVECGYCIMRYMKEIVLDEYPQLEIKFATSKNKQYYNQSQYDEVRSEWSEFVYFYIGA